MLSLAALFAVLPCASPASAELKFSGDAAIRGRAEFNSNSSVDDVKYQYRIRLKAAADLGDGFFFNALAQNEDAAGSWATVTGPTTPASNVTTNGEKYPLQISNFYFGRNEGCCNYKIGRLPLNSFNNPIFDLALYAVPTTADGKGIYAVDVPVATWNFDRFFGINYNTKLGDGDLSTSLLVLDNHSTSANTAATSDGLLNDGYALHISYKNKLGDVTVEPQAVISLTDIYGAVYRKISPNTFGANATIPAGDSKIGVSAFYTICKDSKGETFVGGPANVDYNGYLLRLKGESGPAMAWVDYNHTKDNLSTFTYNNVFLWAQYNIKLHEGSSNVNLTPTVRYRASGIDNNGASTTPNNQLRAELYTTVTF